LASWGFETGAQAAEQASLYADAAPALLSALLRAANAGPDCVDILALCREFLATNPKPSAKARREFWPQLRRLRATAS